MNEFEVDNNINRNEYIIFLLKFTFSKTYFIAISCLGLALIVFSPNESNQYIALNFLLFQFPGIYLILYPFYRILKAIRRNDLIQKIIPEKSVFVGEQGIRIKTKFSELTYLWPVILRHDETKTYLILYIRKTPSFLIRKKGISNAQIDFIKAKISEK